MKNLTKIGLCIASIGFAAYAESEASKAPTFNEYREAVTKLKADAPPKIVSNQDIEFKTRIIEASRQPVNFAGHYVFSSFGCGASCMMSFALDKKSGEVTWLPFTVCCWDDAKLGTKPISFKKDSRLIIITGSRNEQGSGVYHYELKKTQFDLVQSAERR